MESPEMPVDALTEGWRFYTIEEDWMTKEEADAAGVNLYCAAVNRYVADGTSDYEYFYADTLTEALILGLEFMHKDPDSIAIFMQRRSNWFGWVDQRPTPWALRKVND